jgi:hypothetical protein
MQPGELLHMDFAFWDHILSRNFTAVLAIVDISTHIIWLFFTARKKPPINFLRWFFANLSRDFFSFANIRVDAECALARSSAFTTFIKDEEQLNLETTGGYASFINGEVERPNHTLAERARCMLLNAGSPKMDWCFGTQHAGEIYRITYHSAIGCSPHFAWSGKILNAKDMHIWGCRVLIPAHNLKKSQDRAIEDLFYGFAKTHSLLHWLDVATYHANRTHGVRFLEFDPLRLDPPIG